MLIIGETLRQCEKYLAENVHPRVLADGIEIAKHVALQALEDFRLAKNIDKELLLNVARTSLRTKLKQKVADQLTEIVVDAILTIKVEGKPIDLFMVEIQTMQHKYAADTRLIKGLVLDHGTRHPGMPRELKKCHILTCNVSLEFEQRFVVFFSFFFLLVIREMKIRKYILLYFFKLFYSL